MPQIMPPSIKDKVLAAISSGQIKMHPRWHYVLKGALAILGVVMLMLGLLFLISFIMFYLHHTGAWFAPSFGFRGAQIFLTSLPWVLILTTVVFLILLEVLVKRYAFAYRQPLLYSALALIALVTLGGVAVAQTPLHSGFLRQAREHRLPFGEQLYKEFGMKGPRNIHPGTVRELIDSGFILGTRREENLTIRVTPQTRFPEGYDISEGDLVLVVGEREGDTVEAFGVKKIEAMPGEFIPRRQFPRHFRPPLPLEQPLPVN